MEQNVWSMIRGAYLALRKGLSKKKLMLDLNMMVKRGKISSGKTLQNVNVMFRHHDQQNLAKFSASRPSHRLSPPPREYEFSCTNRPATINNIFSLFSKKHKRAEDLDIMAANAAVLEMIQNETGSPAPPGLGGSPIMVRELRVTDSPFPMSGVDEDRHVDEAADRFISRFYDGLRRENAKAERGSS